MLHRVADVVESTGQLKKRWARRAVKLHLLLCINLRSLETALVWLKRSRALVLVGPKGGGEEKGRGVPMRQLQELATSGEKLKTILEV
jgi:hypothetical protein